MNIYKALNLKTGEELEGSARGIFKKTGAVVQIIYKYSRTGEAYLGIWKFERVR
jgi:hypothetical protein